MKKIGFLLWVILTFLTVTTVSYAAPFSNQYLQFELPGGWECQQQGPDHLCFSQNPERQKEAIIVMAAKIRGEKDTLESYQSHLEEKKTLKLPNGTTLESEAKYTKMTKIGEETWIESLHLGSEVPGFYTRYLVGIKGDLGVAITFSMAKEFFEDYQIVFDKIIPTLKITRQELATSTSLQYRRKDQDILPAAPIVDEKQGLDLSASNNSKTPKKTTEGGQDDLVFYLLGLVGVGAFIYFKRKKKP